MIRVTADRRTSMISTGKYVNEKDWNATKCEVRASHPQHAAYNAHIKKIIRDAEDNELNSKLKGNNLSAVEIKNKVTDKVSNNLVNYFERELAIIKATREISTYDRYKFSLDKLKTFLGKRANNFDIENLTLDFIRNYEAWLLTVKGNAQSTVNKELETLSHVVKKVLNPKQNPFTEFKYTKTTSEKDRLTINEINAIAEIELIENQGVYRDVFITQFLGAGMRISDALGLQVKDINEGWINYTMYKTNKQRAVRITPRLQTILDRYSAGKKPEDFIFPLLRTTEEINPLAHRQEIESKTSYMNKVLKLIATRLKIYKHITTHTARHSFADLARQKTKDIRAIQQALGHSDMQTTQRYLASLDRGEVSDLIDEVIG